MSESTQGMSEVLISGRQASMALLLLLGFILVIYIVTVARTWVRKTDEKKPNLRGLYLPQGSIRGLIAFLLIGGFLIFVFFGHEMFIIIWMDESNKQVVKFHTDLYEKILSIFGTLTASITGFYFGGRYSQNLSDQDAEKGSSVKSGSDSGEG